MSTKVSNANGSSSNVPDGPLLQSLPSNDRMVYYDSDDNDSLDEDPSSLVSNRGQKLKREACHVRRGRLGTTSLSIFGPDDPARPSGGGYDSPMRRRKLLENSFHETSKKRLKINVGPFQSLQSSSIDSTMGPTLPTLPPPPRNPVDLVSSPYISRMLSANNDQFQLLAMSAIGLIEADAKLIRNLVRVCDVLTNDAVIAPFINVPAPLSIQYGEQNVKPDTNSVSENAPTKDAVNEMNESNELNIVDNTHGDNQENKAEENNENIQKTVSAPDLERKISSTSNLDEQSESGEKTINESEKAAESTDKNDQSEMDVVNENKPEQEEDVTNLASSSEKRNEENQGIEENNQMQISDGEEKEGDQESRNNIVIKQEDAEARDEPMYVSGEEVSVNANDNGENPSNEATESKFEDASKQEQENSDATSPEAAEPRRSGRVANRGPGANRSLRERSKSVSTDTDSTSNEGIARRKRKNTDKGKGEDDNDDGDDEDNASNITGEEPFSNRLRIPVHSTNVNAIERLASPEGWIKSLFVTDGNVEVPRIATSSHPGAAPRTSGTMTLTPEQQESTVRTSMVELQKFLEDTIEYRDRLGDVRDQVLGMDRRRRGFWSLIRLAAEDHLDQMQAPESYDMTM